MLVYIFVSTAVRTYRALIIRLLSAPIPLAYSLNFVLLTLINRHSKTRMYVSIYVYAYVRMYIYLPSPLPYLVTS